MLPVFSTFPPTARCLFSFRSKNELKVGNIADNPEFLDFTLPDTQNREWSLSDNLGEVVALLFYAGDGTLRCTKQLCDVRDNWSRYLETGAGGSRRNAENAFEYDHFIQNYIIPLTILADACRSITKLDTAHGWITVGATRRVAVFDVKAPVLDIKI